MRGTIVKFEDGQYGFRRAGLSCFGLFPSNYLYLDIYDYRTGGHKNWRRFGRFMPGHDRGNLKLMEFLQELPTKKKKDYGTKLDYKNEKINK